MSDEGIQLSPQLMQELRNALLQQDPRTADDVMAMQYLVAAVGMLMSDYNNPQMNKPEALQELSGFMQHVFDYMEKQKAMRPPQQEAFGVWKPE